VAVGRFKRPHYRLNIVEVRRPRCAIGASIPYSAAFVRETSERLQKPRPA
jgi:hypothetical protein